MVIGTCVLELLIYESFSLKDKRQVIKSIIGRLQSRFNISIAEIELNESWDRSLIGFACVTNDRIHANKILSKVINFIDKDTRLEIISEEIEII